MSLGEDEKQGESQLEEIAANGQKEAETGEVKLAPYVPGPDAVDITPNADGGVWKEIRQPGQGEDRPMTGDTVSVHYVGTLTDGTKFDSSRDRGDFFEFQLGKGSVIKAWDLAVATMKRGELCIIQCTAEYGYGKKGSKPTIPPNASLVFEIELFGWKGEDISDAKDGGILKSLIKEGEGYKTPRDMASCDIHVVGKVGDHIFEDQDLRFFMGEGFEISLIPGLERAVKDFKLGEQAVLKIASKYAYGSKGNSEFGIAPDTDLEYVVELKSFENVLDSWQLQIQGKFEKSEELKTRGTNFFKAGRYEIALRYYNKVVEYLKDEEKLEGEEAEKRNRVLMTAHLNIAMCYLKVQNDVEASHSCDEALKFDPKNEKGLFRRGTANQNLCNYEAALRDFNEVLNIDPQNKAAHKQATVIAHKLKEMKDRERKTYAGMFDKFAKADAKKEPIKLWKDEAGDSSDGKEQNGKAADLEDETKLEEPNLAEAGKETSETSDLCSGDQPEAQPA